MEDGGIAAETDGLIVVTIYDWSPPPARDVAPISSKVYPAPHLAGPVILDKVSGNTVFIHTAHVQTGMFDLASRRYRFDGQRS